MQLRGMRMVPFRLVDGAMADGAMAGRRLGSGAGAGGDDEPEDHHRRFSACTAYRSSPFKARAIVLACMLNGNILPRTRRHGEE